MCMSQSTELDLAMDIFQGAEMTKLYKIKLQPEKYNWKIKILEEYANLNIFPK